MRDEINEASLMAYADGELDEASAEAIELAVASDPRLARRIADFLRSRRLARAAMGTEGLSPVPDDLSALLAGASPPAAAAPIGRSRPSLLRQYALSVSAAAALFVGFVLIDEFISGSALGETVAILEGQTATELLDTGAAGEERVDGGVRMRAIATYRLPGGQICREVHLFRDESRLDTIECLDGARWAVRLVVVDRDDGDSYTPAAAASDPVDAYLSRIGAGDPLIGDAEMAAIRAARP